MEHLETTKYKGIIGWKNKWLQCSFTHFTETLFPIKENRNAAENDTIH